MCLWSSFKYSTAMWNWKLGASSGRRRRLKYLRRPAKKLWEPSIGTSHKLHKFGIEVTTRLRRWCKRMTNHNTPQHCFDFKTGTDHIKGLAHPNSHTLWISTLIRRLTTCRRRVPSRRLQPQPPPQPTRRARKSTRSRCGSWPVTKTTRIDSCVVKIVGYRGNRVVTSIPNLVTCARFLWKAPTKQTNKRNRIWSPRSGDYRGDSRVTPRGPATWRLCLQACAKSHSPPDSNSTEIDLRL
jgi:hypothetical protein